MDNSASKPDEPERHTIEEIGPARRILIKSGIVLSMDPAIGDLERADLLIDGSRIEAVGHDLEVADALELDASNMIVMPGFVDSHRHAWYGQVKRLMPNVRTLDEYRDATHRSLAQHFRAQDMYAGNLMTAISCIDSGITTIVDNAHNCRTPEHADAAIDALQESGIRAVFAAGRPLAGEWANNWPGELQRLRKERLASNDALVTLAGWSRIDREMWPEIRKLGIRIVTELFGLEMANSLPSLRDDGFLGPDNIFNHCTGLTKESWEILRDTGARVNVCPRADAQYAMQEGFFTYQHAIDHGLRPALSADLEGSYGGDMFTEMRVAFFMQRAMAQNRRFTGDTHAPRPVTVRDMLEAVTIDGAYCAGLSDTVGSLTPGKRADVILIRHDELNVMPLLNAVGLVVQAADRGNVDTVIIDGRICKLRGAVLDYDKHRMQALAEESRSHLFGRLGYKMDIFAEEYPTAAQAR
ncbi:MAG: amidohydrolase family protein [Rhizobiaceae bacterium]|nr:amidohydrolase family protein [Rhizobiaceae bacterium]